MEVEILSANNSKRVTTLQNLSATSNILQVKEGIQRVKKHLYPERQSIRTEPKGKSLKDEETLQSLGLKNGASLYLKDLGPQIGWSTVFLVEYAGPLVIYLIFYNRPWLFYGDAGISKPIHWSVKTAAACWTLHYAKRLLETVFVHRFSHATMPLFNLFKNCAYYWMFAAYVAYHVNHPLYTAPSQIQIYASLAGFVLCELGNLSIHIALRNLRPPGTKQRKIPKPTSNPFTLLFNFVSFPNYTYEFGSWISFTLMTRCLPAGLFALAGFCQMAIWAVGRHRNYKKEFPDYPKNRKAIIPFVL